MQRGAVVDVPAQHFGQRRRDQRSEKRGAEEDREPGGQRKDEPRLASEPGEERAETQQYREGQTQRGPGKADFPGGAVARLSGGRRGEEDGEVASSQAALFLCASM